MKRFWCTAALVAALASTVGCDDEGAVQGQRGACADSTRAFVGCEDEPIETPEDACWRLVECGVIPLSIEEGYDWGACVRQIERLSAEEGDFALRCVEAASCDDLLLFQSPTNPWGDRLCFEFGQLDT
jgi:hypothetical protein